MGRSKEGIREGIIDARGGGGNGGGSGQRFITASFSPTPTTTTTIPYGPSNSSAPFALDDGLIHPMYQYWSSFHQQQHQQQPSGGGGGLSGTVGGTTGSLGGGQRQQQPQQQQQQQQQPVRIPPLRSKWETVEELILEKSYRECMEKFGIIIPPRRVARDAQLCSDAYGDQVDE